MADDHSSGGHVEFHGVIKYSVLSGPATAGTGITVSEFDSSPGDGGGLDRVHRRWPVSEEHRITPK